MEPDEIVAVFATRGYQSYAGEGLTQLQHAWQCGRLARDAGATPALELAAWLHDLGHLIATPAGLPSVRHADAGLHRVAARALASTFGPEVTAPIALQIEAKRYLVATDASYWSRLAPGSRRDVAARGGALSAEEADAFERRPGAREAIRLSQWDERANDARLAPASAAQALDDLASLLHAVAGERPVPAL